MADNKKYLDLNGLGYTIRKIDNKKADLESPAFTGTPTAPTAAVGTNTEQIATTAFVQSELKDYVKVKDSLFVTQEEYEGLLLRVVAIEQKLKNLDIGIPFLDFEKVANN